MENEYLEMWACLNALGVTFFADPEFNRYVAQCRITYLGESKSGKVQAINAFGPTIIDAAKKLYKIILSNSVKDTDLLM